MLGCRFLELPIAAATLCALFGVGGAGGDDPGLQRKGEHRHRAGCRQPGRDQDHRRRSAAARHRPLQGQEQPLHLRQRRRCDRRARSQGLPAEGAAAERPRSRDLRAASGRRAPLRLERGRQPGLDRRHQAAPDRRRDPGRRRARGHGHQPRRAMDRQHLGNHQHGAFHRQSRRIRSSPTSSSTAGRAMPSGPRTARKSGSRPRSAARSASSTRPSAKSSTRSISASPACPTRRSSPSASF